MKHFFYVILISEICVLALLSCISSPNNNDGDSYISLGDYESVTIKIDPDTHTRPLEANQYTIDSILLLNIPDSLSKFDEQKVLVNNEKIYIMDSNVGKTILVFDLHGNFLYKLGERGRAKNEYPYGPTDFFVSENGNVHVFDMDGNSILIFDNEGNFKDKIETPLINSFGMTTNNKYLYCIDNAELPDEAPDPTLLLYDFKSKSKKALIPSKHFTYHYHPRYRTFFYNDAKLYHIPILSDSIIVFNDDFVEKVVRFDFACGFLSKEKPECVRSYSDGTSPSGPNANWNGYKGVEAIDEYQESQSYIYMCYIYKRYFMSWFYNKRTQQIIHGLKLFAGLSVFNDYFLKDNQIIAFVGKENVEMLKEYCESEEFDKEEYKKTPSFVKAFQTGKISAPALVYITIK